MKSATWFRKMLLNFDGIDDGRMSTQKCRRFPPDSCELVS